MGLDITAYRGLTKVSDPEVRRDEYGEPIEAVNWDTEWLAHPASIGWAEEHFPGRSKGVEPGAVYRYADSFQFRAGSYSGYGAWRAELAQRAAGLPTETCPFAELINFADNEGVIGPVVSAKLAREFAEHEARILDGADAYFAQKFREWRKAFEMAADHGAVAFH